ncbi:MAG TPA: DUF305 domain-containing protein [Acidimicrobiales bacterium]|nr:DUF305 domain-containing protein [Acidimicrobiales bacterium]
MPVTEEPDPVAAAPAASHRWLSTGQVIVLVAAVAFLVGAIAYVVGDKQGSADPLNDVDVGFMQDMGFHHDQAVQMSLLLLDKEGVDPDLKSFATEVVVGQRYEQGIFSSTLDRFGHSSDVGDTVMGWMGEPQPTDTMAGLATDEQMEELANAEGEDAEALWIALMSEHHLAGLHMADYAARHGKDRTTVNLAKAIVKNQRSEVLDYARYRESHDLPIPDGFTDPTKDQRLDPLSFRDQQD